MQPIIAVFLYMYTEWIRVKQVDMHTLGNKKRSVKDSLKFQFINTFSIFLSEKTMVLNFSMPLGSITVKFSGAKLKSHRHFFNFGFLLEILITIKIQTFSDCLGLQVKFWHNLIILSRYESKASVQVILICGR